MPRLIATFAAWGKPKSQEQFFNWDAFGLLDVHVTTLAEFFRLVSNKMRFGASS